MSFFELLEQMPMHQKFMKEVISKWKPMGDGVAPSDEKVCEISLEGSWIGFNTLH